MGLLVAFQLLALVLSHSMETWITTALLFGVVAVAGLWSGLYLMLAEIVIEVDRICWRTRLGRRSSCAKSVVGGIAFRSIRWASATRLHDVVVVYGRDRHSILRLPREYWSDKDLALMHRAIAHGGTPAGRVVTARDLAREFPGAITWWEQHNVIVGFALATVVIAFGTALAESLSK
jgi:hypothetical protein